ncbi:MAG: glycosyltransferase [Candidatus Nanoarchaeia archaeon]|nr:glycosyltransferase [Candidatus Nanoarchaeia archaeon]MDD5587629.1 glycosyltransferase [Candidatus Nanoarchaeia archaeon]
MVKLSVIVPAYNESKKIYSDLKYIIDSVNRVTKDFELILVNDGSKDNTLEEVKKIKDKRLKILTYEQNKGKGYALKYGFNKAKGKYITFMDADLDINPGSLENFFKYMEFYNADIIIGSKKHPQSKVHYPILRRILSKGYQIFNFVLFRLNVTDTQSGLKLLKYECAKDLMARVTVKKYAFDLELLVNAKRRGYKVVEAPIVLDYKFGTTINLKAIIGIFVDTLGIAYRTYILRTYDK